MPAKNCSFGWHCWRTVEGLAHQLSRLPWESVGWACAPSPLASLVHFACLNSSFQHKDFLYLIEVINSMNRSHVISKLASGVPLLSCAAVKFILEKFWISGARKSSPWLGACWSASRRGVWQSYLITDLAGYLPRLQLFLSSAVSSSK